MLLGEPNHTDFDIHFQCFGISVRIHPGFWAISALLSLPAGREPLPVLGFALAIFLSILIHEMGHALAFRKCGIQSHVVLYHFGGLAVPDSVGSYVGYGSHYSPRSKIFVTAMGPGVQMLSAVLLVLVLRGMGKTDGFLSGVVRMPASWTADPIGQLQDISNIDGALLPYHALQQFPEQSRPGLALVDKNQDALITLEELVEYESELEVTGDFAMQMWAEVENKIPGRYVPRAMLEHLTGAHLTALQLADRGETMLILWDDVVSAHLNSVSIQNKFLSIFCFGFIQIGLFWALLNLVPVYPLDGGQITRELFVLSGTPNAVVKSLKLSIASGVVIGLVGMKYDMMFIGIMFFLLAYSSYQLLQRMQGRYF